MPKIALPATKVSAPASAIARMLSTLTPPSTSRLIGRPVRCTAPSMILRAARIFSSACGMNDWPPKPGFTDMMSTMSSLSITCISQSSGVAGLNTRPAVQPDSRMRPIVRSTCSEASGWNVMFAAPAFAKSGTMRSTGLTIRCTSIGTLACGLIAAQTSGPIVRLGT